MVYLTERFERTHLQTVYDKMILTLMKTNVIVDTLHKKNPIFIDQSEHNASSY